MVQTTPTLENLVGRVPWEGEIDRKNIIKKIHGETTHNPTFVEVPFIKYDNLDNH